MCPEVTVTINGEKTTIPEGGYLFIPHVNGKNKEIGFLILNNGKEVLRYDVCGKRPLNSGSEEHICNFGDITIIVS